MHASISLIRLSRQAMVTILLLFMTTLTYAQITPTGDSYTNSAATTTNYGAKTLLDVESTQTSYIQFNLASIPTGYTGADVTQATLKLYVNAVTTAGSFNVDYVNGTWSEAKITYANAPALGTTIAAGVPLITADKNQYILVDITSAVQAWLNGTEPNNGIALVANSTFNASFDSKENTTTSHPPELDIVLAAGGTITGVATASGSGLQGGGTSGTLNLSLTNACAANQILQWNGTAWACATAGAGTITGVTAGTDLTGGGTSGNITLNLDITKVPQLATANTFIGNQTVNGNLSASGVVTGSAYQIGSYLFAFGSYANANAFLGFAGNATMTGLNNTASGYQALVANATGGDNTASGSGALASNTAGWYNTASGYAALHLNTQGNWNTASGYGALSNNTTGSDNTASGTGALASNTLGTENVAVGANALLINVGDSAGDGSYNTAVGVEALWWNNSTSGSGTNASYNAALGYQALDSNTTGSNNTASGTQALQYNTTGSNNTALGYGAGPDKNSTALVNSAAIGANAVVSESNALVLGGTGSNAVNVGIGTATPSYTLDVQGSGRFTQPIVFASGQTFSGTGTVTGVTAGTGLTGGGTSGNVTLNVDTTKVVTGVVAGTDLTGGGTGGNVTLNLNTANVPLLAAANTFTGAQTINNNVTINGSGYALTATSSGFTGINGVGYAGVLGSGTAYGVYGSASNGNIGVYGTSGGTGSYGVYGNGTYGVYGTGTSYGVYGTGSSYGLYGNGTGSGSYGVYGNSSNIGVAGNGSGSVSYGLYGNSGNIGIFGAGTYYAVFADGNLGYTGSITGGVALPDDRVVSLYAIQSPENWFEDFGSGELKDGVAVIKLEATFAQTVNTEIEYHVFLTPKGDCKGLYVTNEIATGFEVRELGSGQSSVAFDYRIVAKRRGLESVRLEDVQADRETAEGIRKFIATRPSNPPRLRRPPQPPEHPADPKLPKLEPTRLPPVAPQHVAIPEPTK